MSKPTEEEAQAALRTILSYIGDDPAREGLAETPARVLKAWRQAWGRGYGDLDSSLTTFENDGEYDQMVVQRGITYHSHCEHHMALFVGEAAVAYIPRGRIIGLSKLARIVEHFASRLQVQERLTNQVADFIAEKVSPDCAVMLSAVHSCMTSRGVKQPKSDTVTTALRGIFKTDAAAKAEFLSQVKQR